MVGERAGILMAIDMVGRVSFSGKSKFGDVWLSLANLPRGIKVLACLHL
jgi:hypothetical protein